MTRIFLTSRHATRPNFKKVEPCRHCRTTQHSTPLHTTPHHSTPLHTIRLCNTYNTTQHTQKKHVTRTPHTWATLLMSDHNTDRVYNTTHKNTPHRPTPQHTAPQHHNLAHTTTFVPHTTYITPQQHRTSHHTTTHNKVMTFILYIF